MTIDYESFYKQIIRLKIEGNYNFIHVNLGDINREFNILRFAF